MAVTAALATCATLDPDRTGPGITCDELYHVLVGKRLVNALVREGWRFWTPERIAANFPWRPDGPPVHPPLGNMILGCIHALFDQAPEDPWSVSLLGARFASAAAYGLVVFLVGVWTGRRLGAGPGTCAATATALVPRMFAHAHLAALDMLTTLTFVAAVLAVAEVRNRNGRLGHYAAAGLLAGAAMLTRFHGLLLLPPVAVWIFWTQWFGESSAGTSNTGKNLHREWMMPAFKAGVWGASALAVFFAGWPWLWLAPVDHFKQFLGTGIHRQAIHVFYFGRVWLDREVPWHYGPVMLLVTLPAGLIVLGLLGLWEKHRHLAAGDEYALVLGTIVWVLGVFAWPGVPVYDGVRLFLMVFPLWMVFAGAGAQWILTHPGWFKIHNPQWRAIWRVGGLAALLAAQGVGVVVYHPCQLSHYNLLVGGLWGAERLGFEVTYWGDAVQGSILKATAQWAAGQTVAFGPHLAPYHAPGVIWGSRKLATAGVQLLGWQREWTEPPAGCRFAIVYHRKADLDQMELWLHRGKVVKESQKQGVWLARLLLYPLPSGPPTLNRPRSRHSR